jgi:hypothetical protein
MSPSKSRWRIAVSPGRARVPSANVAPLLDGASQSHVAFPRRLAAA